MKFTTSSYTEHRTDFIPVILLQNNKYEYANFQPFSLSLHCECSNSCFSSFESAISDVFLKVYSKHWYLFSVIRKILTGNVQPHLLPNSYQKYSDIFMLTTCPIQA